MNKLKNGHHFINMHHTETDPTPKFVERIVLDLESEGPGSIPTILPDLTE